jgi:hypothetical protein
MATMKWITLLILYICSEWTRDTSVPAFVEIESALNVCDNCQLN